MIWTSGTKLITAPASEPITRTEVKTWLKVDATAEDDLIDGLIASVRAHIENLCGIALFTQTVRDVMDRWPEYDSVSNPYLAFYLLRYPVASVANIQYVDSDGATQTLSTDVYKVDNNGMFTRIALKKDQTWPALSNEVAAITINYTAGWSDTADIPADLKTAMKLLLTYYFERRADGVKQYATTAEHLIRTHYAPVL